MHSIRLSAGRFIEIRIASPFDAADLKVLQDALRRLLQGLKGKGVACSDLRQTSAFTQDVVQGVIELTRSDNPIIERSGILVSQSAVFSMQMDRIVRSTGNPNRRSFRDPKEGVAWLSEVLNAEERAALQRFVFP